MRRPSRWIALVAAIGLALAISAPAYGYVHQTPKLVIVSPSRGTMKCGVYYTVKATVLDKKGHGIQGVTVHWSFKKSPSKNDKFNDTTTPTNKHGWAYTKVKLACKAGDRIIRGKVGVGSKAVSGTAVVHVSIPHKGAVLGETSKVLPNTSTLPATVSTSADRQPSPAIPVALVILAGVAIILRRLTLSRR